MSNQAPDPRPFALSTAVFGAALLFLAWKGEFDDPSWRFWAGGLGAALLVAALLLTPRPPR